MSTEKDGGPAFPVPEIGPYQSPAAMKGMTLRQWLAGLAMQGLVSSGNVPVDKRAVARVAFEYADAMLQFDKEGHSA